MEENIYDYTRWSVRGEDSVNPFWDGLDWYAGANVIEAPVTPSFCLAFLSLNLAPFITVCVSDDIWFAAVGSLSLQPCPGLQAQSELALVSMQ